MSNTRKQKGNYCEHMARVFLEAHGLKHIQSNFRCKQGEIDLIMRDKDNCLVFVEVRYRSSSDYGGALQSVNRSKQKRIWQSSQYFLLQHPHFGACRFDTVSANNEKMQWIKNAFTASRS